MSASGQIFCAVAFGKLGPRNNTVLSIALYWNRMHTWRSMRKDPEQSRIYSRKYYLANRKKIMEQVRQYRVNNREKISAARKESARNDPDKYRAQTARYRSKKIKKYDQKHANEAVFNAIQTGKLIRPKTCSKCGMEGKVDGHHPDYTKRLEVIWLCRCCHMYAHVGRPNSE